MHSADYTACQSCLSGQELQESLILTRVTATAECAGVLKLKEKALEGLGLLFIAQPSALMEPSAAAAMRSALRPSSAACLKLKALGNLLELLKVPFVTLICSHTSLAYKFITILGVKCTARRLGQSECTHTILPSAAGVVVR